MLGEGVNNIYSFLDGFNIEKNFIKNWQVDKVPKV